MVNPDKPADIDRPDEALFGLWAEAFKCVTPPADLRQRVLARVRASAPAARLRTVRAGEGWIEYAPGIEMKMLYRDDKNRTNSFLARLQAGVSMPEHDHATTEECLVIEGEITLGEVTVRAGDYHWAAKGAHHGTLSTRTGALLYLRIGWGEHIPEAVSP